MLNPNEELNIAFRGMLKNRAADNDMERMALKSAYTGSGYELSNRAKELFTEKLAKNNVFRRLGSFYALDRGDASLWYGECNVDAEWTAEGAAITEEHEEFVETAMNPHKLAQVIKVKQDFASDKNINIEEYLAEQFGRNFGRAEENAMLNGDGIHKPTGLLKACETGLSVSTITFDDVIKLYYSVDKKYRKSGVWLMNDDTATQLRLLKNNDGIHLWNENHDTILGKPVEISEFMPEETPLAFGDLGNYIAIQNQPFTMKVLAELYTDTSHLGYRAIEQIDGKLAKADSVKKLEIAA